MLEGRPPLRLLTHIAVAAVALALCSSAVPLGASAPQAAPTPSGNNTAAAPRPNILFILTDDLGYGQLGYTGNPDIKTPNIDRLAKRGIEFTQAYAGGPVCSPSRIALLTGKGPRSTPLVSNAALLRAGDRTVANMLSDAGYRTALFGKFGVGLKFGVTDPMTMGFQQWVGLMHNVSAHRQYPQFIYRNNAVEAVDANTAGAKGLYAQRLFTDEALKYIDQQDGEQPFFAMVTYTSPHAELAAPEAFVAPYANTYRETPWPGIAGPPDLVGFPKYYPEPVAKPSAVVAGMIAALDSYIGELVAKLDAKGLSDNTIIVFTSDNGPHREGGANPLATYASSPYRGEKRDLYDGGIHEPMLLVWPRAIAKARRDDTPLTFADMLPTFAAVAGVPAATLARYQSDGVSLAPRLSDRAVAMNERTLYWAFGREVGDPNSGVIADVAQAARRGWIKAVRMPGKPVEIFDLKIDPAESNDLSQRRPALAKEFSALFDAKPYKQ